MTLYLVVVSLVLDCQRPDRGFIDLWKPGCLHRCHLREPHLLSRVKPLRQVLILCRISTYHQVGNRDVRTVDDVGGDGGSFEILDALRGGGSGDRVGEEFGEKLLLVCVQTKTDRVLCKRACESV